MKARLITGFVLVVCIGVISTWAVSAQRPTPTPSPGVQGPTPTPPRGGPSLQVSPPPMPDWQRRGDEPFRLPAATLRTTGRVARPAAFIPGSPGLSFRYLQTFGVTGTPYFADTTHINFPYGVASDGTYVFIADSFGRRVLRCAGGSCTQIIGNPGVAQSWDQRGSTYFIGWIADVGLDSGGCIWVVDSDRHHIIRFCLELGAYVWAGELGEDNVAGPDNSHFNYPAGIAFDSAGNIYVSDGAAHWETGGHDSEGNQRIQIFNSAGTYLNTIGVTGVRSSDNNHFNDPHHIAIYGNLLYVADTGNHRVQIFNVSNPAAPSWVWTIGVSGVPDSDNAHLNSPLGVTVDASYIYVADSGNHRVQIYNRSTRAYVATIGSGQGSNNSQFNTPADVAVDTAGNIYVADFWNARVQQFNSSRTYVRTYGTTGVPYLTDNNHYNLPRGVAVAPDGSIYIAEQYGHRLVKLNAAGTPQCSFPALNPDGSGAGIIRSGDTGFNTPQDVAIDEAGRVYVADTWNHRVVVLNSNCTYYTAIGSWSANPGCLNFDAPEGLTIAPGYHLYVADTKHHCVKKLNVSNPLAPTCEGTIGVCNTPGSDNAHFNRPEDVAVDNNDVVYVGDSKNHRVQKCTLSGGSYTCTPFAGEPGISFWEFGYLNLPHHLAVDATNRLYVSDHTNDRIEVFDQSGAYLTTIGGSFGDRTGQMRNPFGVAVDSSGNVFIADWDNHRIKKYARGVPNWSQRNLDGFGTVWNRGASALESFGGYLYAGTYNLQCYGGGCWTYGAGLQRMSNGGAWEVVTTDGFGDWNNIGINDLSPFNGQFYAGTVNPNNGGEVCRSSTGSSGTWTCTPSGGFGETNGEIVRLGVFTDVSSQTYIYATTYSYTSTHGAEIWRSSTGNSGSWTRVVANCFGDANCFTISALTPFGSYLYAGKFTYSASGAQVWRSNDGTTWSQVNTSGFGSDNNTAVVSLAEFNGYLYAGTRNWTTGGQIWRCTSCDSGGSWSQVVGNGFGKVDNGRIEALQVFDSRLYAVTYNSTTGSEVWRSANGTTWEQVGFGGFGDSNNYAPNYSNASAVFNNRLFIGTWALGYANGGQVWEYASSSYVYLPLALKNYGSSATWVTITSQDFEGPFPGPWIVFDNNGTNYGEYYWAKRNCRPYAGSYSGWAVGGGANGSLLTCGSNYPDYADSWMVYGPFSLVGATAADMKYKLWLNSESGYDYVCRLASTDGSNFSGWCTSGYTDWTDRVLDLANVPNLGNLLGQLNVWVALQFYSDENFNYVEGGYVDNIVLRKCVGVGVCPAGGALAPSFKGHLVEFPVELTLCKDGKPCPQPKTPGGPKK